MKMRQVPCISGPCTKHLSVFAYGRYWDHLSLYGHMERIEIQITAGTRSGILGKTIEVYLLQTCFVTETFGSSRTGIAIRNAWRLLVLKICRYFTLDRFWFNMLLKFKASMPLLANLTVRKGRSLVSVGSGRQHFRGFGVKGFPAGSRYSNRNKLCPSSNRIFSLFIWSSIYTVFALKREETVCVSIQFHIFHILWPNHIQWQPLLMRLSTELYLLPNFERFT